LRDQPAVADGENVLATRCDRGVVTGDQDRGAGALVQVAEQVEDRGTGDGVEVAGRLAGDEQGRVVDQGAGDRDALLLAAGQLGGQRAAAIGQADRAEQAGRPGRQALAPLIRQQRRGHAGQHAH